MRAHYDQADSGLVLKSPLDVVLELVPSRSVPTSGRGGVLGCTPLSTPVVMRPEADDEAAVWRPCRYRPLDISQRGAVAGKRFLHFKAWHMDEAGC